MDKAVEIKNLSKNYNDIQALSDVSFDVKKNELIGVIGPDGAGKTTLFRILTTLLLPSKGTAKIMGYDSVNDYKKIRSIIGYMPGRFSLYQDLTVEENLDFYATIFNTTIEKNYELIKDIYSHIEPFKKRLAGQLSGGMKQKLALSCALIHKPVILILDEPTTGVDAVSRKEFWEMLKRLKDNNVTILVSTPYMDEAKLCDRVALMNKGKIMAIDTPLAITQHFDKKIIQIRTQDMYRLKKDIEKYSFTNSAYLFGQSIHFTGKQNYSIEAIRQYLIQNNHSSIEIQEIPSNIEDCFMDMMVNSDKNEK